MTSITETPNLSVSNLFQMSDELDKSLYLELISEQCSVIYFAFKGKKYPPKCSGSLRMSSSS
jgi:hypothetical protein